MRARRHSGRDPFPLGTLVVLVLLGAAALVWFRTDLFRPASSDRPSPSAGGTVASGAPTAVSPSPTSSPETAPSPEPQRGKLVIHGTGDVNVDPDYIPTFQSNGYGYAWSGLDGLFRRDDLTVINLECSVTTIGSPEAKDFTFQGDPAALGPMREAGVEVANLGNNHGRDFGGDALIDTYENLLEADIAPVGAGRNLQQARKPVVFERKGWKIAVVGMGGVVEGDHWFATETSPGMADGDDIAEMVSQVKAADRVADLVVVSIHWGVELDTVPRPEDVERAKAMIDAGADAIFGHHAHRLQPLEFYEGKPIFYSLGNFVWPNFSVEGSTTGVAQVVVQPNGKISAKLLPAFIEDAGHPVLR